MKLNNGYEYTTIYDLSSFLKRITNSTYFNVSKCTVKVSTEDILKCIENTAKITVDNYGNEYFFKTYENTTIDTYFFSKEHRYSIISKDQFGRTNTITKSFVDLKIFKELYGCDGEPHNNYDEPAVIYYDKKEEIKNQLYYIHGMYTRKDKFNKLVEKVNKIQIKNLKRYNLQSLIDLDQIAMDIGNAELHEAMKKEIEFKKIIKELEK